MSLSRRGFLTAVLGASTAALVLPKIDLIAAQLPVEQVDVLEGPLWRSTFEEIHREAYACFIRDIEQAGRPLKSLHEESKIGQRISTGEILAHQASVGADPDGLHVPAAMAALSRVVLDDGLDRYGILPCPNGGVAYAESLGPLRMIAMPDRFEFDRFGRLLLRFDVVGASSEPSFVQRRRTEELKLRIRRRIAFYKSGRHPVMW